MRLKSIMSWLGHTACRVLKKLRDLLNNSTSPITPSNTSLNIPKGLIIQEIPLAEIPYEGEVVRNYISTGMYLNKKELAQRMGLAEVEPALPLASDSLYALCEKVRHLEGVQNQLKSIKATLLLNFGLTKHNKYGFVIHDEGQSTERLLIEVLENLTKKEVCSDK